MFIGRTLKRKVNLAPEDIFCMKGAVSMGLTDQQKQIVKQWVEEGCKLSDLQKKLESEFGVSMTYMDVRFLVIDLGLEVKDGSGKSGGADVSSLLTDEVVADDGAVDDAVDDGWGGSDGGLPGKVSVSVDRINRPGSIVSGNVTFSDGVTADWVLDQLGRLALESDTPKYAPSKEDVRLFQEELRKILERQGF